MADNNKDIENESPKVKREDDDCNVEETAVNKY